MPRAQWGISASDVDEFDRTEVYKPYAGPPVPNAVYLWRITKLQSVAGTSEKNPQIRVGLELVPRGGRFKGEEKYDGYWIMAFLAVSDNTKWLYVPFLDAIGVSGIEFIKHTMTDEEGNIRKIGKWRNTGEEYVRAQLKDGEDADGNPKKVVGWIGPAEDEDFDDEESIEDEDDEEYYDEEEDPV